MLFVIYIMNKPSRECLKEKLIEPKWGAMLNNFAATAVFFHEYPNNASRV
jgi:hypothetical protein